MFSYQSSYSWRQALLSVITGDNNTLSKYVLVLSKEENDELIELTKKLDNVKIQGI